MPSPKVPVEGKKLERALRPRIASPIQHVVFIIQENRSFNNLFVHYPGATTQDYGYDTSGNKIMLSPEPLAVKWDIDHSANGFFAAYNNGANNGWNDEGKCCGAPANAPYTYVRKSDVNLYWQMATQYVLADQTFQSNLDGSFVAHQYGIAAFAAHSVNYPSTDYWGCPGGASTTVGTLKKDRSYGPAILACFDYQTVADEADAGGVSWRFYTSVYNGDGGIWSAYQAISQIYNGPDWSSDVVTPQSKFISDVGNGNLAAITWITPTMENSDHLGSNSATGPAWVASLVNAVGESSLWSTTAIFILWDDWGGLFDPVVPIYEDYDGLGYRVPMIIISPYAKKKYVSHVQYETSSVLKFIEDNFGFAQLAASDARANDPAADTLDYSKKPRPFTPFAGAKPLWYWLHQAAGPYSTPRNRAFGD